MFKLKFKKRNNDFIFTNLKRKCHTAMFMVVVFAFSIFTAYAAPQAYQYDIKEVNLICDGFNVLYYTTANTYREFIEENKISISPDDVVSVNLDDNLNDQDEISITRVSSRILEVDEEIPYTSASINDANLPMGQTKVSQAGQKGIKRTNYEVICVDGVEVSRTYLGEYIAKEPVNEVVSVGTAPQVTTVANTISGQVATVGGETFNYKKVITCQATAYDLSFQSTGKYPGHPAYGLTASGTYAKVGTVAVDPRVIPLGTKMYIVSTDGSVVYGYCTAEDTGGAIKGNKVDLFYNTTSECLQFGRRSVYVYIL